MEKDSHIAKENKDKEVAKCKLSRRMVAVINKDLLTEKVEVIVNSIGSDVKNGFGGIIAQNILLETGNGVIAEAVYEAYRIFDKESIYVGEYVSTSAGRSKTIKYIVHCCCPEYSIKDSVKILTKLITNILTFCDKMKVESISFPPLSSGRLYFPISECAKAFFNGVMEFLDKHLYTSLKKLNIVVIEKDKHKKFLDEWSKCYKARFGDDDEPSSDEKSEDDVSNSTSDEEVKRPAHKKPVDKLSTILSISSDDDSTNKKSSAGMKKNTKMLFSSSDDDKPKKKASVKNNYSDDSEFDFPKKKVGTKTKLKTAILDSDSSDEVNQNQKAVSKKKKDSTSNSDSDSDPKSKKKAPPKKILSSDSDD